jgi:hypothetical protein
MLDRIEDFCIKGFRTFGHSIGFCRTAGHHILD